MKNYICIDTLKAYAAGKLYGEERQAVEAYLQENPHERKVVDGLTQYFKDHRLYQWNFRMKMHEIRLFATIKLSQWAQRFQKGIQSFMPSTNVAVWLRPVLGGACLLSLLIFFLKNEEPKRTKTQDSILTQKESPCEKENIGSVAQSSTKKGEESKATSSQITETKKETKEEEMASNTSQAEQKKINRIKIPPIDSSMNQKEFAEIDTIGTPPSPPQIQEQIRKTLKKKPEVTGSPAGGDKAKQ